MQDWKDCLQAELKMMREDLHKIMLELTERTKRASKLQAKYETQCSKRIGVESADEARSQVKGISFAFLVIFILSTRLNCMQNGGCSEKFKPSEADKTHLQQVYIVQAYYVIKAAQDKQELLQQKQDILNSIEGGEGEVAGLESAVADMTCSNAELAQSFK